MTTPPALSAEQFTVLVERFAGPLYAFLAQMLGDRELARDVLQDTLSDAWRAAEARTPPLLVGSPEAAMRRWLYWVAYRRAISAQRHQQRIHWETLDEQEIDQRGQSAFPDRLAEQDALSRALAHLPPPDVACLTLIVIHGFTASEASTILGASPQAIAKRLSRAKQRLLTAYLAEEAPPPKGVRA